jgi:hypothetical protein
VAAEARSEFEARNPTTNATAKSAAPSRGAGRVLRRAKNRRQKESAEAAGRPDHAGDDAHARPKTLRHELEDRAVPHAEATDCQKQHRDDDGERWEDGNHAKAHSQHDKEREQKTVTTDSIGEPSAHRSQQASRDDNDRREVAGAHTR